MILTRPIHCIFIILLTLGTWNTQASYSDASYEQERKLFKQARTLLKQKRRAQYKMVRDALTKYPLLPYLEYEELRQTIAHTSPAQIESFLERFPDTPVAPRLRNTWLKHKAQRRNWHHFLRLYKPSENISLRCWYRRALWNTGHKQAAYANLQKIWISARSLPKACDPLFREWQATSHLKSSWVWQRFALAIENRQSGLASYLKRFVSNNDKKWMNIWLTIYRNPSAIQNNAKLTQPHPYRNRILIHGVKLLARSNRERARAAWNIVSNRYSFTPEESRGIERHLFLAAARDKKLTSIEALLNYTVEADDLVAHQARLHAAIRLQQWTELVHWVNALPKKEHALAQWRYWMARALLSTDTPEDAKIILAKLATEPNYYGFLAADKLDLPYSLSGRELPTDPKIVANLRARPALIRARELYLVGRYRDMFREWRDLAAILSEDQLLALAEITHEWKWLYHTIATIGKTPHRDFLEERFPTRYSSKVKKLAAQTGMDPSWIFGIIRQESAFAERARSSAGAGGLMQLMPATAKEVWKSIGRKARKRIDIFGVDTNLLLGTSYLRTLRDRFGGQRPLATASYNAGPHRVKRWIDIKCAVAPEIWIESIPFKETRNYVKRVMAYSIIYQQRLGLDRTRLHELLGKPIGRKQCRS